MITTNYQVVSPAYGRDYRNAKDAKADFLGGKDFVSHVFPPQGGGYCSVADFAKGVVVNIRYAKMTKICSVTVP